MNFQPPDNEDPRDDDQRMQDAIAADVPSPCEIPPLGWRCTRQPGHEGPCAAVECPDEIELVLRGMERLKEAAPAATAPVLGTVQINGMPYQRPVIRVAVVTVDGSPCTVPVGDLLDMLEDTGKCTVELKTMSKREFDELPEFTGF